MGSFVDRVEHQTITAAGWTYRANERGLVIYRDPKTGLWHTRSDAIAMISAGGGLNEHPVETYLEPTQRTE